MAKRSRESFQKRAREKARQDKQAEKREKRQSSVDDDENVTKAEETALMEQFASLSERLEVGQITPDEFNEERERIFGELGLETD
ncbi:MAG TPA: hypothetical protein VFS66_12845 [Acidimicrobiia bacterium]|nr:hypothetical protein [Acidimicrobiia bacterium]